MRWVAWPKPRLPPFRVPGESGESPSFDQELLVAFLLLVRKLLVAMPGAPFVASLLLVVRPGAASSFLLLVVASNSDGLHLVASCY